MEKITGGHEWTQELCRALGFDPSNVRSLTLRLHPSDVVTVVAEVFVDGSDKKLIETVKKVAWLPDDE